MKGEVQVIITLRMANNAGLGRKTLRKDIFMKLTLTLNSHG